MSLSAIEYRATGAQLLVHPDERGKTWNQWIIHVLKHELHRVITTEELKAWQKSVKGKTESVLKRKRVKPEETFE